MRQAFLASVILWGLTAAVWPQSMTDATGQVFPLGPSAKRVISIAPSLTEEIFALGGGNQLVGDTTFCRYPEAARLKTKIGSMISPNYELIVSLHPDLIVATADGNSAESVHQLRRLGLRVFVFSESQTFASIDEHFHQIAQLLGRAGAGDQILSQSRAKVTAVHARVQGAPPVRTFIEIGREPLVSANRDTFVSEILRDAGAINCMEDSPVRFPHLNLEVVLRVDPEAILINDEEASDRSAVAEWERFGNLAAVRAHAIYVVDGHLFATPTPMTFAAAVEKAAQLLHPESR